MKEEKRENQGLRKEGRKEKEGKEEIEWERTKIKKNLSHSVTLIGWVF